MDIPLSSDALDLALHPSPSTHLLAVGLISGKVQLLDLSQYQEELWSSRQAGRNGSGSAQHRNKKKKRSGSGIGSDNSEEEGGRATGKGKAREQRLYEKKWTTRFNNKSCRGVEFNHDGSQLWSLSKEGTLYSLDTATSSVVQSYPGAHASAPSRLLPLPGDPNLIVTGDDEGVVNLWDTRFKSTSSTDGTGKEKVISKPIRTYDHHFDWITDFHYSRHLVPPKMSKEQKAKLEREKKEREERKRKKREKMARRRGRDEADDESADEEADDQVATPARERLVCTSGDGSLSVIDLRGGGSSSKSKSSSSNGLPPGVEVSDDQEDELLSITSVKSGGKLVVGTQLGLLSLWAPSRGLLDHIDRIPGHPASIDTLLPLDDSTILTGSSDGLIRVVQILPHKFLGVVADHGMGLPVERMKRKQGLLVSCGHGGEVKVTDVGGLLEDGDESDEEEEDDGDREDAEVLARKVGGGDASDSDPGEEGVDEEEREQAAAPSTSEEESAQSDDDSDSDSSSPPPPPRPLTKKEKQRLATLSAGGPQRQEKEASDFFADL